MYAAKSSKVSTVISVSLYDCMSRRKKNAFVIHHDPCLSRKYNQSILNLLRPNALKDVGLILSPFGTTAWRD